MLQFSNLKFGLALIGLAGLTLFGLEWFPQRSAAIPIDFTIVGDPVPKETCVVRFGFVNNSRSDIRFVGLNWC